MKPNQRCCLSDHSSQWVSCLFFLLPFKFFIDLSDTDSDELTYRGIVVRDICFCSGWSQMYNCNWQLTVLTCQNMTGHCLQSLPGRLCPFTLTLQRHMRYLLNPWAEPLSVFKCMMPLLHFSLVCRLFPCDAWLPDSSSSKCSNKAVRLLSQPLACNQLDPILTW